MSYNQFKDLENRTKSDIALKNKDLKIASDPKYYGAQRGLAAGVYKFFNSRSKRSGINQGDLHSQLANEFHKPIIRKFERRKVYSSFKDNIWGVDLADMQLIGKFNRGIKYLLCVIDLFGKYVWFVPLKDQNYC